MNADLIERLRETLPGVQSPAMRGDNLVITLASFFEPHIDSDEMDESETWKRGAVDAANEVLDAIHAHYADRIAALEAEASEGERLRAALRTIAHTFTEDSHGGMKTMSASYYQEIARRALIFEAPPPPSQNREPDSQRGAP